MLIKKVKQYITSNRISTYSRAVEKKFLLSPYNISNYENFIYQLNTSHKIKVINFDEEINSQKSNFIFRHDLDTVKCLQNSHILADLHLKHSIPLSIFVRMDDLDYNSKSSYLFVSKYVEHFPIGLHSSCYIYDNPLKALRDEIQKFQNIYNFSPKFLTLHGLGTYKYEERIKLIDSLSKNYKDFGFDFADFISSMRNYNYVIQDCHKENNHRFLKKDIITLPPLIKGSCYLLLAHPCYWE